MDNSLYRKWLSTTLWPIASTRESSSLRTPETEKEDGFIIISQCRS